MSIRSAQLAKPYHDAVLKWRDTYLPDYSYLMDHWEQSFPTDPRFELCAYREDGMCSEVEVGVHKGKPKALCASELEPEQASHLLAAIRAQASTEFGSIQQHRTTLARAQDAEEQIWILRMMAEELRHGYQMLHLLMSDDWTCVTQDTGATMVEEILSMTTGSHLLGAFNIEFDSFVDSAVFCALIDRVGKYQLEMQKVSAYKPMAESMPQMLREEAFHLAAGVVPMRRWMQQAARGEVYVTVDALQRTINKWLPRGVEMFGDERGGGTNVRFGLKPMKNAEAQRLYYEELDKVIHDLNSRYVRARLPELDRKEAKGLLERILADRTTEKGIAYEDLLHTPDIGFFRRRGVPSFEMIGVDGERFDDVDSYLRHLSQQLPESYLAGSDFSDYVERLREVEAGEMSRDDAAKLMPTLRRVGGTCICSKSVRWVAEEQLPPVGAGMAAAS
jgi:1,2-phenylacetyl-CoA epoxidase catalytic subunit